MSSNCIQRAWMEAPSFNVSMIYLIGMEQTAPKEAGIATSISYTDVALRHMGNVNQDVSTGVIMGSIRSQSNPTTSGQGYFQTLQNVSGGGLYLYKSLSSSSITQIGTDSLTPVANLHYYMIVSASGSTIKSFEWPANSGNTPTVGKPSTPQISVTDTSLASGYVSTWWYDRTYFGSTGVNRYTFGMWGWYYILSAQTALNKSLAIIESDLTGTGPETDPFRPTFPTGHTWGALDFRNDSRGQPISNSFLLSVTKASNTISSDLENARIRGKRTYIAPYDYDQIIAHAKQDHRDWLITKNELRFVLEGDEVLEPDALADFYEREKSLGRINANADTLDETLRNWISRAGTLGKTDAAQRLEAIRRAM